MKQKAISLNPTFLKYSKFAKIIVEVICVAFILLFIYAAMTKLLDYSKFKAQIGQSPLLTDWNGVLVWLIPSIEIVVALLLAISKFRKYGFYASFVLMLLFTGYIIAILNFGDFIPCSCGGILEKMTWNQHLIFNIAFVGLAMVGVLLHSSQSENSRVNTITPKVA